MDKYEELLQSEDTDEIIGRIEELKGADELVKFSDEYVKSTGNDERLASLRAVTITGTRREVFRQPDGGVRAF